MNRHLWTNVLVTFALALVLVAAVFGALYMVLEWVGGMP